MIKIYQSILDKQLFISIIVDGEPIRLNFSGGEATYNGVYITGDKSIQNAIESNNNFNKLFRLHKEIDEKSGLKGPGTLVNGTLTAETLKAKELLAGNLAKPVNVDAEEKKATGESFTFKTINDAQEILTAEPYMVPVSKIRTIASINAIADELGISVTFSK